MKVSPPQWPQNENPRTATVAEMLGLGLGTHVRLVAGDTRAFEVQ